MVTLFGWTIQTGKASRFWYMAVMIGIYLILSPLSAFFRSTKRTIILTALLFMICAAINIYNIVHINEGAGAFIQGYVPTVLKWWDWLLFFCLGGLIGRLELQKKISVLVLIVLTFVFGTISICYMYYMLKIATNIVNGGVMYESVPLIAFSVSIFCLLLKPDYIQNNIIGKIIIYMGSMLIPIYAIHYNVIELLVVKFDFSGSAMQILLGLIVIAVCTVVGSIMKKIPYLKDITRI